MSEVATPEPSFINDPPVTPKKKVKPSKKSAKKADRKAKVVAAGKKPTELAISDILVSPELQMRAGGLVADHVEDLRAAIKAGKKLPPIKLMEVEGRGKCLYDGHHSLDAYTAEKWKKVPVIVKDGTWEEAILAAAASNLHEQAPLKRTTRDKQRAVRVVLKVNPKWTARQVADHVHVSHTMVNGIKREDSDSKSEREAKKAAAAGGNSSTTASDNGDGHESEEATSTEPVATDPVKKKAGKETFDWKAFDASFGVVARTPDLLKKLYDDGFESEDYTAAMDSLKQLADTMKDWRQRVLA